MVFQSTRHMFDQGNNMHNDKEADGVISQRLPYWVRFISFLAFLFTFKYGVTNPIFRTQFSLLGETADCNVTLFLALSQLWRSGAWPYMILIGFFLIIAPITKQVSGLCDCRHKWLWLDLLSMFDLTAILSAAVLIIAQSTQIVEIRRGTSALLASSLLPWAFERVFYSFNSQRWISANLTSKPRFRKLLLATSVVLFIGSMLLPILQVRLFDLYPISKSILGGIKTLWDEGSRPAAILILLFSVAFPGLKILSLMLGEFRVRLPRNYCTFLVAASPWSMLDVLAVFVLLIYYLNLLIDSAVIGPALWMFILFVLLSTYLSHDMYGEA